MDYEGHGNNSVKSSDSEAASDHIVDEISESSSEMLDHMGGVSISPMQVEAVTRRLFRNEPTGNRLPPRHREHQVVTQPTETGTKVLMEVQNLNVPKEWETNRPWNSNLDGLDKILSTDMSPTPPLQRRNHRRTRSEPVEMEVLARNALTQRSENGTMPRRTSLKRVESFGQVDQEQPSLLDQARRRCASYAMAETSQRMMQKQMTQPVRKHSR